MSPTRLLVAGTYTRSDAYPNVKYRLERLRADERLDVLEVHRPLRTSLDYRSRASLLSSAAGTLARMVAGTATVVVAIVRHRHRAALYVPYPAIHVLWLLSLLPRAFAPRHVVADAFISVHDTVVNDRRLLARNGLPARALFRFERRAFRRASVVVVDTPENARFCSETFGLPRALFVDVPLSIPPIPRERGRPPDDPDRTFRLVFVGTLVPLHGVELLCDALDRLPPELAFEVVFCGDGQQSAVLERFVDSARARGAAMRASWIRDWQQTDAVVRLIRSADLCLGIFGDEGKARRVWPFKNYLYLACGRPVVSADTEASRRLRGPESGRSPLVLVDCRSARPLAACLESMIRQPERVRELRAEARAFHDARLSEAVIGDALIGILTEREDL